MRVNLMNKCSLCACVLLMSLATWMGASADEVWTVRMNSAKRISVESADLYVDFSEKQAWTIRNIKYKGDEIVGEHGANGSVVNAKPKKGMNPKDPWIGTGHGKEEVVSFSVVVDNQPHEFKEGLTLSGKVIIIRKESKMGPLGHNAKITFPESGDCIIEKHSYTVLEDLKKRYNYVYAFMHCNNNALDQWFALLADGHELEGKAGKQDNSFSLRRDMKSIVYYSEALGKGVAYAYPEVYKGAGAFKNSIWDRKNDNKLYFRPEVLGCNYKIGDEFEFVQKVTPFSAKMKNWKEKGRALVSFDLDVK